MLGWLTIGGLLLVMGILADDWLASRYRRPLSHMRPHPKSIKGVTGMEDLDITRANQKIAKRTQGPKR